jgi:hypothetical protein
MSPRDDYLAASVVRELEKGGALKDPRPGERLTPLADHALAEARRSIKRVRRLKTIKLPDGVELPKRTAADYHKAGKAMRKIGRTEDADWLEAVRQTPPPRADVLNYRCAAEAFDLITFFSAKKPTKYRVCKIAEMIREGVTGKPHTDTTTMRCSAALVIRDRRRYYPQAFQTP